MGLNFFIVHECLQRLISRKQSLQLCRFPLRPGGVFVKLWIVPDEGFPVDPVGGRDFGRVGTWRGLTTADEDRANFIFDHAEVFGSVAEVGEGEGQFDFAEPEFICKPPVRGRLQRLPGERVPAAGVRPDARPRLFRPGSLLHEHLTFSVEKENREGAMQRCILRVDTRFVGAADGRTIVAKQNDFLTFWRDQCFKHQESGCRLGGTLVLIRYRRKR